MGAHEEVRPVLLMLIRATPYRHQIKAFNLACGLFGILPGGGKGSGGCALLMEMGTGKSLTSIAITGALVKSGCIRRVLIVAPLSIRRRKITRTEGRLPRTVILAVFMAYSQRACRKH